MIEHFKEIKEIDSLDRQRKELKLKIKAQEDRVTSINQKLQDKENDLLSYQNQLKELTLSLTKLENELSLVQQKLELKQSQKTMVFSDIQINSLEKEIGTYKQNINTSEEIIFESMEKKEFLEQEIVDSKTFIKGATSSLKEIESDAKDIISNLTQSLATLDERIHNLTSSLPESFKVKVLSLLDKNLRSTILATINDRSCNYCRNSLASQLISEIEDKHLLKSCSSCKRLFIPSASSY